jgi:hypothetical protein
VKILQEYHRQDFPFLHHHLIDSISSISTTTTTTTVSSRFVVDFYQWEETTLNFPTKTKTNNIRETSTLVGF